MLAQKVVEIKKLAPLNSGMLSYPSKLSLSPDGKMLAISDSNHNTTLVVELDNGTIIYNVGSGDKVCITSV